MFDELEEITDSQSADEGIQKPAPKVDTATTVEVDIESGANVVVKAVREAAGQAEQAAQSVQLIATRDEITVPSQTQAVGPDVVKLFEREDLAMEAKMRVLRHPSVFTTKQTHGSNTCFGTYEFPESMYMKPIGWGGQIFPAHIALYYPKPRVPHV